MSINRFFSDVIGIKLHNHVWSWGVYDERNDAVFLKIHDQDREADYEEWVLVYAPNWRPSRGHRERLRHLELVRQGAKCYGVCRRTNRDFDTETFLKLGRLEDEGSSTYAEIIGRVPVTHVLRSKPASASSDIDEIEQGKFTTTEKTTLVAVRIGQGEFRLRVLRAWNNRCAVTGVRVKQAIRASHSRRRPIKGSSSIDQSYGWRRARIRQGSRAYIQNAIDRSRVTFLSLAFHPLRRPSSIHRRWQRVTQSELESKFEVAGIN